jgi:hypothetical protein
LTAGRLGSEAAEAPRIREAVEYQDREAVVRVAAKAALAPPAIANKGVRNPVASE